MISSDLPGPAASEMSGRSDRPSGRLRSSASTSTPVPPRSISIGCGRSLLGGDLVHLLAKPGEPLHHRLVFGDFRIRADDERQRILHLAEGRGYLHQPAELDRLVEIARRRHDKRKDDRELGIAGGEPGQLLAALMIPHQFATIRAKRVWKVSNSRASPP